MAKRKSFLLRMDPRLWEELEGWAHQEMRSVNGQIEYLLKQSVVRRKGDRAFEERPPPSGRAGGSEDEDEDGSR